MRRWIFASLLTALLAPLTASAQTALTRLDTAHAGRAWDAVGRLQLGGRGFCTGALIAPDLVLTAAHCLFEKTSGQRLDGTDIAFLAGFRNGRASAIGTVRRAVIHPGYEPGVDLDMQRVHDDLALLELERPIRNGAILPFRMGDRPRKGETVGIVSYALDRADAPSLEESCRVLARQRGALVTSCAVDFGASGAPIFRMTATGAEIVSVVSAKAEAGGRRVALGTGLAEPLGDLRAMLARGEGIPIGERTVARQIEVGGRTEGGAKFVRP